MSCPPERLAGFLGPLGLDDAQIQDVALRSALIHFVAALIVPVLALAAVVPWRAIRRTRRASRDARW